MERNFLCTVTRWRISRQVLDLLFEMQIQVSQNILKDGSSGLMMPIHIMKNAYQHSRRRDQRRAAGLFRSRQCECAISLFTSGQMRSGNQHSAKKIMSRLLADSTA